MTNQHRDQTKLALLASKPASGTASLFVIAKESKRDQAKTMNRLFNKDEQRIVKTISQLQPKIGHTPTALLQWSLAALNPLEQSNSFIKSEMMDLCTVLSLLGQQRTGPTLHQSLQKCKANCGKVLDPCAAVKVVKNVGR